MPAGSSLASEPRLQATVALALLASKLNGDFAETGVYSGGTSILMAKVMIAHSRKVLWAADSFQGLPPEDVTAELAARKEYSMQKLPPVKSSKEGNAGEYSSSRQVFEQNLARSGLGNNARIKVLQGWFNETLPRAPIQKLAFLRLDGDIYVSTRDALEALYDKVVPGGYIYVDDYGSYTGCRDAVNQFLLQRHAAVQLHAIQEGNGFEAVWWQKVQMEVVYDHELDLNSPQVANYLQQMPAGSSLASRPRLQTTVALAILASKLNGDFAETGVYSGGTSILMAKVMLEHSGVYASRLLWAADSFQGLPPEDVTAELAARKEYNMQKLPPVKSSKEGNAGEYSSSRQVFEQNLARSGLGNNARIKVLQGWFNETLPGAPIQKLAFLRLDGDIYVSTRDALEALYDKVVPGGYIYVDDYGSYTGCRDAVNQFLLQRHAAVQLHAIQEGNGFEAVWWRKE